MKAAVDDESLDVTAAHVLVLRNAGPQGGPGMPEWGMLPIPKKLLKQGVRDMVRISDARMSGTSYGACILHVAPESYIGGPLALVRTGDLISVDVAARRIHLEVERRGAGRSGAPPGRRRRRATSAATAGCSRSTSARPTKAATSTSSRPRSARRSPSRASSEPAPSRPRAPSSRRRRRHRAFLAAIAMAGEARRVAAVHRRVVLPRPAAELRAPEVGEGRGDLGRRVHDERPLLHHRLADRPALEQQELGDRLAGVHQLDLDAGAQLDRGVALQLAAAIRTESPLKK